MSSSLWMAIENTAMIPPSVRLPVSPMNTCAGKELYQRNPTVAPISAPAKTTIPFFKNNNLDYANAFKRAGENAQKYGWILFVIMAIFVVTAVSNSANLTDGMDGLATGSTAIIGITLGILAYLSGNINYAGYLNIIFQ